MLGKSKSMMHHIGQSESSQGAEASRLGSGEQISPLNFEKFIPWVCIEWGVSEIVSVLRLAQPEEKIQIRRSGTPKAKSVEVVSSKAIIEPYAPDEPSKAIKILASYDNRGNLTEISIIKCPVMIPRKLILAFSLCIPFHPTLTRLTIRYRGIDHLIIYEISKLLPQSNITNICLDDTYVLEGNYYILLEETSQLTYLSLNRCKINDKVCERIAAAITHGKPASSFLRALELGSNNITDIGAQYLGTALRANRCLMHLNLSGNKLTDAGASAIFDTLKEFRLTDDEVLDMKRRKFRFLENKQSVYKRCLAEIFEHMETSTQHGRKPAWSTAGKNLISKKIRRSAHNTLAPSIPLSDSLKPEAFAEKMVNGVVGEFIDPFDAKSTKVKDGHYYCEGNLVLCSLNLAYNDLHLPSLLKLEDVVMYQVIKSPIGSFAPDTESEGLLRVVIDGNFMPESCDVLDRIEFFLKSRCGNKLSQNKRHMSIVSAKKNKSLRHAIQRKKSAVAFNA